MARSRTGPFADVPDRDWFDWRWQTAHRLTTVEALARHVPAAADEADDVRRAAARFPMALTPYLVSRIDPADPACPIRAQWIPSAAESAAVPGESDDPLAEEALSPVPGLVRRYPDRALLLLTDACPAYCRHCTRRRRVGSADAPIDAARLEATASWIAGHPEIREVILSGGEPLLLDDARLERVVARLRRIPHVALLRIHTRVPAVLPMRVTGELCRRLRAYHPIQVHVQFNHPVELTEEARGACGLLADHGFPLGNQAVLLRGVNDRVDVQRELGFALLRARVRPFYLLQCDPARGTGRFRTPVAAGIAILEGLRGHVSGTAVPTFVVDCPGGGGKVPLGPRYEAGESIDGIVLRSWNGDSYVYPERADGPSGSVPAGSGDKPPARG
jgi:lysine 2,3-aminomutase